jgi:hypothetical protein
VGVKNIVRAQLLEKRDTLKTTDPEENVKK